VVEMSYQIVQVMVNGLLQGTIYALIASGFSLVFGVMGIVQLSYGAFYMLGCYITYLSIISLRTFFFSFPLVAIITFVLVAIITFVMGLCFLLVIRRVLYSLNTSMVLTFVFAILLEELVRIILGPTFRTVPRFMGTLEVFNLIIDLQRVIVAMVAIIIIIGMTIFLSKTKLGKAIRFVSEDKEVAMLMGINPNKVYIFIFGVSTLIAGIAGFLITPLVAIYPAMGYDALVIAFMVSVLAGLGTVKGCLPAGLICGLLEALVAYFWDPAMRVIVLFLVVILIMVIRPQGLFGKKL